MLFRSNDTATTEIYTPVNTLSLHDALPIGPVIENGFYYDFAYKRPFTPEDQIGRAHV